MKNKPMIFCGVMTSTYAVGDIFGELITYSSTGKPFPFTIFFFLWNLTILGIGAYSWWHYTKQSFATE